MGRVTSFSAAVVLLGSGLAGVAAWPEAARATIVGISDDRGLLVTSDPGLATPAGASPSSDFADFAASLGTEGYVLQDSSITATRMLAEGEAVGDQFGLTVGESVFEIQFEVTETQPYQLSGSVQAEHGNISVPAPGNAEVILHTDETVLAIEDGESGAFFHEGELQPGVVYTLSAFADLHGDPYEDASYEVDFVVPEASSEQLALAGLAALGLLAARRRSATGASARS